MTRRQNIMRGLSKAAYAAAIILAAALIFGWILLLIESPLYDDVRHLQWPLLIGFSVLSLLGDLLNLEKPKRPAIDIAPRYAGLMVVLATGAAAFMALAQDSVLSGIAIGAGTLVTAAAVWRFATKNANEIGEARFDNHSASE